MAAVDAFILILVVVGFFAAYRAFTKPNRELGKTPAQALGAGDTPFIEQARNNWKMARRAVHSLEKVIDDDDIWPLLPEKTLMSARKVIADFYEQEDS